jgi:uncharacterized protein YggU (UPF0235/DUF167 family)
MPAVHLRLEVRLTPRSARDAIEGEKLTADGRKVLAARVRAVPEDGRANAALLRLLAEACGVAAGKVSLVAGASSRLKSVRIEGDPSSLAKALGLSGSIEGKSG